MGYYEAMTLEQKILRKLESLDRNVTILLVAHRKTKGAWVTASELLRITGWSRDRLRQERDLYKWSKDMGVEFRKLKTGGFMYNLKDVPEYYLRQGREDIIVD